MPSFFTVALAVYLYVLAAAATSTKYDWVGDLPSCWETCLSKTSEGCHASSCICAASQNDSFLSSAVECARDRCYSTALELSAGLLGPAQIYCAGVGNEIPDAAMSSALACAAGASASSTSKSPSTTKKASESAFKSTVTSTLTQTSTDHDGNTLQIIVPIVVGPSTVSTGDAVTSTITSSSTSASSSSSAAASPSQTAQATSVGPTQAQGPSSSATAAATQKVSNSNGSPFENMQASASHWSFPGPVVALGLIAGLFMRL